MVEFVDHNQLDNLITLCRKCHAKWDSNCRKTGKIRPENLILQGGE